MIDAVENWGRTFGMTEIEGPLGFTDFDPEGMLTEGFDRLGTMSSIYNYPYYSIHLESLGFQPSAQWVEWQIPFHDIPDKMLRIADVVLNRYDCIWHASHKKGEEAKHYAKKLFALVNEGVCTLYG